MHPKLLDLLACPHCHGRLDCHTTAAAADGNVSAGDLRCSGCDRVYPIVRGIPRFVACGELRVVVRLSVEPFPAGADRLDQRDAALRAASANRNRVAAGVAERANGFWMRAAAPGASSTSPAAPRSATSSASTSARRSMPPAKRSRIDRTFTSCRQAYSSCRFVPVTSMASTVSVSSSTRRTRPGLFAALPRWSAPADGSRMTIYERRRSRCLYSKVLASSVHAQAQGGTPASPDQGPDAAASSC